MALKDIAKQSIKQAVKRMTTSEMAQDLARMKSVQDLRVKPPSDNVANVRDANFSYPKTIGNQTVNIKDLTGGVRMSDPKEVQRVKALADKIASPEGYISRIIVDHNNNVVEGQHRLEALRQLGVKDVPVYKIEDLADTMPVSKMEEAMREVGGIRSDHVNQLMQHALDAISEGGIEGARQLDYGKFQKHYDAALDAADVNRVLPAAEREANLAKMLEPSKVPQTLYHGTGSDISEFRPNTFFSDDPKIAGMYAKSTHRAVEGSGPNIMPVNVQLKNPYVFDENEARKKELSLGKTIAPDVPISQRMDETYNRLKAKGHDGVILKNFDDIGGRQTQYIVFEPKTIKSAIGNRGTYDITDPDITKAEGGAVHLAGGGLKGYIKEPLKQAAKRIMPKTSFEMAHDLARMRASLPVEKGGLGLPINNTSEDRARAMGFDVNAYHATDADITKFDNAKLGSNTSYNTGNDTEAVKSAMRGHWFSDRDLTNKDPRGYMFGDVVYPVKLANHKKINDKEFGSESYIVKDPDQIRSTNAAFDPFRRDAATAAAMGVAAPDLLAKEPEKKADGGVLHLAGRGPQQLVKGVIKQAINRYLPNVHYADPLVPPTMRFSEALGNAGAEGKILNFTETDRSRVHGPNRGGAGFSTLQHYSDPHTKANTVWGFGNKSVATKKINQNDPENVIWTTYAGSPQQHKSNSVVIKDAIDTLQEANRKGEIHPEQVKLINERINQSLNQNGNPLFSEGFDITDPKAMDYATTFDRRAAISDALLGVGVKKPMISKDFKEANPGVIWKDASNINGILTRETDPAFLNASTNDVGPHLFFMDNNIIHRPDLNEAFPYQVTGSDSGMRFELAPFRSAAPDFINKKGYGPNDTINAWAMSRGVPQQFVSDKYLLGLQKQGYKEGGQVSDDAIKVEMWDKALHKAKGGPILGEIDDRTPEEIENASHAAFKLPKARPRMMAEPFQKPKEEPTYQTATAYDPTIRQRLAGVVEKGLKAVSPKPRARALTENLTGTNEQGFGAADLVPYLGSTMQAQETGRDIKKSVNEGDYVGAAIDAIVGGGFAIPGAISTAKALKPTLKSLGPKAGQMAENYLIKSGMMPQVVKREGGNWIGNTEKKIQSLKSKSNISDSRTPEELQSLGYTPEQIQEIGNTQAINKFIDKNMMNYVKKQMATPSDPVRLGIESRINKAKDILDQKLQNNLQAREQKVLDAKAAGADPADIANLERDVSRYEQQIRQEYQDAVQSAGYVRPREQSRFEQLHNEMSRSEAGYPKEGMATTEPSKQWEGLTDYHVQSGPVRKVAWEKYEDYPWLNKLNPEDKVHYLRGSPRQDLGLHHMIDVLREKLASGEIKPESLNNMSMDNLVHLTGKYDQELAAKMNAERASAREGLPVHKEYPEGYKWIELNKPGSFAAESQAMGHSVRGYEPPVGHPDWIEGSDVHGNLDYGHGGWEGIKSGQAKVYSLVDSKGQPHATIETKAKGFLSDEDFGGNDRLIKEGMNNFGDRGYHTTDGKFFESYGDAVAHEKIIQKPTEEQLQQPFSITQIKGKLNAAPKEEYQPYVQDFVKSGNWSDVGDFNNTGLYHVDKPEAIQKYGSPYLSQQEFDEFSPSLYKAPEKKEGGEIERPPIYHAESGVAPFGIRHSGEGVKGRGWFGVLPNQEGGISTEISAESNGHEYPLIMPSLTKEQLNLLLSGEKPTPEIYKAAEDWANLRRGKGQSPFASPSDLRFALPKKMGGQINHDAMLVELLNKGKRYG